MRCAMLAACTMKGGQFFKLLLSVLFALGKTKQWNTVRSIPISF